MSNHLKFDHAWHCRSAKPFLYIFLVPDDWILNTTNIAATIFKQGQTTLVETSKLFRASRSHIFQQSLAIPNQEELISEAFIFRNGSCLIRKNMQKNKKFPVPITIIISYVFLSKYQCPLDLFGNINLVNFVKMVMNYLWNFTVFFPKIDEKNTCCERISPVYYPLVNSIF